MRTIQFCVFPTVWSSHWFVFISSGMKISRLLTCVIHNSDMKPGFIFVSYITHCMVIEDFHTIRNRVETNGHPEWLQHRNTFKLLKHSSMVYKMVRSNLKCMICRKCAKTWKITGIVLLKTTAHQREERKQVKWIFQDGDEASDLCGKLHVCYCSWSQRQGRQSEDFWCEAAAEYKSGHGIHRQCIHRVQFKSSIPEFHHSAAL